MDNDDSNLDFGDGDAELNFAADGADLDMSYDGDADDGGGEISSLTESGASPWGPGATEGFRPYAQALTDSPPLGNEEEETQSTPRQPEEDAHPGIDPMTLYDRSSYEPEDRKTYGAGIFDMEEGAWHRQNDGIFAHNYALPGYIAREPELDVWDSEAIDINTGMPRVVQPSASGVQMMAPHGERAWSPFAPPPYGMSSPQRTVPGARRTMHEYGIETWGWDGAQAILRRAATTWPTDQNARGKWVCTVLDSMSPGTAKKAMAVVEKLRSSGYQGNAVELAVAHALMHAAAADLSDLATGRAKGLARLDRMTAVGPGTEMMEAARKNITPLLSNPLGAVQTFKGSEAGALAGGAFGDDATGRSWLFYLLIVAGVGTAGYVGYRVWKAQSQA